LAYAAGLGIAWGLLYSYQKQGFIRWGYAAIDSLLLALAVALVAGGRLGYAVLYAPELLWSDPMWLLRLWEPGMASHGAFVGVAGALGLWAWHQRWALLPMADAIVTLPAWGIALGRVANFINGELWGTVSNVPWAVIFPSSMPPGYPLAYIPPRHPSQLYQALLEGVALGLWVMWRWLSSQKAQKQGKPGLPHGQVTAEFLVLYALARWVAECFRQPDAPLLAGMSRGQAYSLGLLAAGLALGLYVRLSGARATS
jgi:phosphatidylglycerol:prolipoprotein diacylglycerol transferase